ncbi:MAG: ABC transporter substrate-binding protein [Patescibacteria group bacterium]|nr:ABC transporter substrate-binding protein [Patescibacteria group bacterium]MDD3777789.1 ABC transporter substrate-binding protein [Patescibacteria group bacterium]MDD3939601.1 ABC transporter substrate-binding protein [Patescibacteria group bacterium]
MFFKTSGRLDQVDIDKKLVYSLSPRKIPTTKQFKYLNKFLSPKESLILKISLVILFLNIVYLGVIFFQNNFKNSPVFGGTYIEATVGYPRLINPLYAISRDVDNDLSRLIYSSLFSYDSFGVLQNDLVESFTIDSEGKEYQLVIKEGVKWHDNEILTSDDVVFTFNLIQDEKFNSPLRSELVGIKVEKINEKTIKFILPEPYAPFLDLLTFGIMPQHVWQGVSADTIILNDSNLKPIGSGPYKIKTLLKSKSGDLKEYQLIANLDYYKEVYIENLIIRFFSNNIEAIDSFNNNQVDGLSALPFVNKDDLLKRDSVNTYNLIKPQIVGLFFNLNKDGLKEVEIRTALAKAIDKNDLINNVYGNAYQVASGPILKNSFAYNSEVENINNYSKVEAAEKLAGKNLKIKLTAININGNSRVAEQIKSYWESVGVSVEIDLISLEQAAETIKKRDFDVILYGQLVGGDPDVYAFWHSSQAGSQGFNISEYKNDEVDKLLSEARVATNELERIEKYKAFQNIVNTDVPVIFLYSPSYTYVQNKKVKGFVGDAIISPADRFGQINDWYIKTKKIKAK